MAIIPITSAQTFRIIKEVITVDEKSPDMNTFTLDNMLITPIITYKYPAVVKIFHPGVLIRTSSLLGDNRFHNKPITPNIMYKVPVNIAPILLCASTGVPHPLQKREDCLSGNPQDGHPLFLGLKRDAKDVDDEA